MRQAPKYFEECRRITLLWLQCTDAWDDPELSWRRGEMKEFAFHKCDSYDNSSERDANRGGFNDTSDAGADVDVNQHVEEEEDNLSVWSRKKQINAFKWNGMWVKKGLYCVLMMTQDIMVSSSFHMIGYKGASCHCLPCGYLWSHLTETDHLETIHQP